MKNGWQTKKIGDVCKLMTGGTPSRAKSEYFGGDIKWLVSGDIHREEIFDCEGRITEAGMKNSNAKLLPVNSVMIALNGQGKTRGTVALLRTQATCNQSLVSIYPKEAEKLLPEFLYANLHGRYQEIRHMTGDSGNDRRGLNMGLIESIAIPIAPVPEQRRIVGILDEAFDGIATAKANAGKNLQNARALFESHLQSVFTQDGDGWVEKTLGDVCEATQGVQIPKSEQSLTKLHGYRRYLYISDFESDKNLKYVACNHPKKLVSADDIIVANTGSAGKIFRGIDGILSNNLFKVSFDAAVVDRDFVYFFVTSGLFREYQQKIMRGTANPHMGHVNFKSTPISIPPICNQKQIVARIYEISEETQRLESIYQQKLAALEALKKSLLHQAFSGQL